MPEQTNILEAIRTVVQEEIRPVEDRLEKKITNFKDEILTAIDGNNKKLDKILSEHPAMSQSIDENRDSIQDHESRIQKVEAKAGLA